MPSGGEKKKMDFLNFFRARRVNTKSSKNAAWHYCNRFPPKCTFRGLFIHQGTLKLSEFETFNFAA